MAERIKNIAGKGDVQKLLRANQVSAHDFYYAQVEHALGEVVAHYEHFLPDLVDLTPRPTAKLLAEAWVLHAQIDGTAFGSRLSAAIQYCRNKLKSCTSGSKLHPAVYRLCQALQKEGKTTLAELIAH